LTNDRKTDVSSGMHHNNLISVDRHNNHRPGMSAMNVYNYVNKRRHDEIHDLTKKPEYPGKPAGARILNTLVAPPVAVSRPVETTHAFHCLGVVYG
jgi:hypothetical protein